MRIERGSRGLVMVAVVAVVATFLVLSPNDLPTADAAPAPAGTFSWFRGNGLNTPRGITAGPDGALWFTNHDADSIGRISVSGVISNYTGSGVYSPREIVTGPDGALWFTDDGSRGAAASGIGRITTAGVVSTFTGPGISSPFGIAVGADGALWFTNTGSNSIGRITTAGVVSTFSGAAVSGPRGIAPGPDGALWYTNVGSNSIGRITTAGTMSTFTAANVIHPGAITTGSDGALYFTNDDGSLGRVTTGGVVTSAVASTLGATGALTAGPDGALWLPTFTPNTGAAIARVTTTGTVTSFSDATITGPSGITSGPDGALWFGDVGRTSSIGRMTVAGAVTRFSGTPLVGNDPGQVVLGPDGALWYGAKGDPQVAGTGPYIGRMTTAGQSTAFVDPRIPGGSLAVGSDGAIWFPSAAHEIGRMTTSGSITVVSDATIDTPELIVPGPDGALWFTNHAGSSIGRISLGGSVTDFPLPALTVARSLVAGPDGAIWFTSDVNGNSVIGRMSTGGVVTTFTDPTVSMPGSITAGPDGALWFVNLMGPSIGRITTGGAIVAYAGNGPGMSPRTIAAGADGALWFTNSTNASIGRITTTGVRSAFASSALVTPGPIAAGPDGAMWFINSGYPGALGRIAVIGAPAAPVNVFGTAGSSSVTVGWAPAGADGGSPVTSYKVTASPGGATCSWSSGPLSCVVAGLTNGQAYTFTVTATTSVGTGPASLPSAPVTPSDPPGAPTSVTAIASNGSATISWAAPQSNGGTPVTGYLATSSPEGRSCGWGGGPLQCTISGLTNGVTYTFTVRAANVRGYGPASLPSAPVTPVSGTYFHPLPPTRILDSRGTTGAWNAPLVAGTPRSLTVAGGATGVPADAAAVVINTTVTESSANSFLTVYPTGVPTIPTVSDLNFATGQTVPNLVTVKVGSGGQISFATALGSVHVIGDIAGYFSTSPADRYDALPEPQRVLDSRGSTGSWNGKLASGTPRMLTLAGAGLPVPATAEAVLMNVTVTNPSANSFLTAYPTGSQPPTASNLNFAANETTPNLVAVRLGDGGAVTFANAAGAVDVIVDVAGYFDPSAGDVFHPVAPTRVLDSRGPVGSWNSKLSAGSPRPLLVGSPVPSGATAVIANTGVTGSNANSYLTVFPSGATPVASNLNFGVGQTVANLVAVKVGAGGSVLFSNASGNTDVTFDVAGYFTPT